MIRALLIVVIGLYNYIIYECVIEKYNINRPSNVRNEEDDRPKRQCFSKDCHCWRLHDQIFRAGEVPTRMQGLKSGMNFRTFSEAKTDDMKNYLLYNRR